MKTFRRFKRIFGVLIIGISLASVLLGMRPRVEWEPYQAEKLESARNAGRPVVIDFYASWCISCHELEQFTYSNAKVIKALAPVVRLKVDLTDQDDPETQALIESFEIMGVPTVIFIDRNGNEVHDSRLEGFVPAEVFLEALQQAFEVAPESSDKG